VKITSQDSVKLFLIGRHGHTPEFEG
jgi:hypothetical protein